MEQVLNKIDPALARYFTLNNITDKDFFCRECGKCLVNLNIFKKYKVTKVKNSGKNRNDLVIVNEKGELLKFEPPEYRWFLAGKHLSACNKTFHRHLCWDCFFKLLPTVEDIPRKARKSKWYAAILRGEFPLPVANIASSDYFKLLFDITDEEIANEKVKLATASLQKFIIKYGEKEGTIRYEAYRNRQAYTCSKEYMMSEKGMSEQEWKAFNASRASTEKNFIARYGEKLGKKKWKEYCELESYVGCKLEYFIDKYGKDEGTLKYLSVNASKALTLENFINKYGEEIGKQKFSLLTQKPYSEVSQALFDVLDLRLGQIAEHSRYATKNGEQVINLFFDDGTCLAARPDYILNTRILEFNGDYWHANPKFYKASDGVLHNKSVTAQEIWDRDAKILAALRKLGYSVLVVWENDYYKNPEKTIKTCLEFLNPDFKA